MGLRNREQLQPSLLDRLTDDEPGNLHESSEKQTVSLRRLRQLVLRDLAWLLNTTNLATQEDLDVYPEVRGSVLNYGLAELSGHLVSSVDITRVEQMLRKSIQDFEPRILSSTVKVRALTNQAGEEHNQLMFEIEGELWGVPTPSHLLVRTKVDLEEGDVTITDAFGTGRG